MRLKSEKVWEDEILMQPAMVSEDLWCVNGEAKDQ